MARFERLLETHRRIDGALQREQGRPRPDAAQAARLKKLKLRIKDLIVTHGRGGAPALGIGRP